MESTWKNKILVITFVLLLLVLGGEVVYYFVFLQNNKSLNTNQNLLPTLAPTKTPSIIINKPIPTLPLDSSINVFSKSIEYIDPYNLKRLGNISLFLKTGIATDSKLVSKYPGYIIKIDKNKAVSDVQTDTMPFLSIYMAKKKDSLRHDIIFYWTEKKRKLVVFMKNGKTVDSDSLKIGDSILVEEEMNLLSEKATYKITIL